MKKTINLYISAGLSVIPVNLKTKSPAVATWKMFQERQVNPQELKTIFTTDSIAVICGKVSGSLEIIDLDNKLNNADELLEQFKSLIGSSIYKKLTIQKTQSGGYHFIYRCPLIEKNQKLACQKQKSKFVAVFETRGEGGYFLVSPSPNYTLIQRDFTDIQSITEDERTTIFDSARSFNEQIDFNKVYSKLTTQISAKNGLLSDDYNARGDVIPILEQNGWKVWDRDYKVKNVRRPGKNFGISGTWNFYENKLFVFSTNAEPFESNRAYDKFQIYALLECQGDFKQAARELAKLGYGNGHNPLGASEEIKLINKVIIGKDSPDLPNIQQKFKPEKQEPKETEKQQKPKFNVIELIESGLNQQEIRYNEVLMRYEIKQADKWTQLNDQFLNDLWIDFNKITPVPMEKMINCIQSSRTPSIHPFKEYFRNLPAWDGKTDWISEIACHIVVPPEQINLLLTYFRKWIIAVTAQATNIGTNHYVFTIHGDQAVGKNRFFEKLVPFEFREKHAPVAQIKTTNKDDLVLLCQAWLIHLDELDYISKINIQDLKSLITRDNVTYRKPYGHVTETYQRNASFCGSVNNETFLTDDQNRRFLIVSAGDRKIHFEHITDDMIQNMYAQAWHLLNNGETFYFDLEETKMIHLANKQYESVSMTEELLLKYFQPGKEFKTTTEIARHIADKELIKLDELMVRKLGSIMKKNNFTRHSKNHKYGWLIEDKNNFNLIEEDAF